MFRGVRFGCERMKVAYHGSREDLTSENFTLPDSEVSNIHAFLCINSLLLDFVSSQDVTNIILEYFDMNQTCLICQCAFLPEIETLMKYGENNSTFFNFFFLLLKKYPTKPPEHLAHYLSIILWAHQGNILL